MAVIARLIKKTCLTWAGKQFECKPNSWQKIGERRYMCTASKLDENQFTAFQMMG